MDGIVITWQQLLYISLVLILFYVAELLLFLRKSRNRTTIPDFSVLDEQARKIESLQGEVESLKVRLAALLAQSVPSVTATTPLPSDDTPYSQAIRLAQQGADSERVSEMCGISRGEADLIVALYRTTGSSR